MTDPGHGSPDDSLGNDSSADAASTPAEESDDADASKKGTADGDEGWVPM